MIHLMGLHVILLPTVMEFNADATGEKYTVKLHVQWE